MSSSSKSQRAPHWLFESLTDDRRYEQRRFFSMDAAYLDGRLFLAVASRAKEPWSGLMVCTDRPQHAALLGEFPQLIPHPVLGKWLYLSQSHAEFEVLATRLVSLARERDPRLGIAPKPAPKARALPDLPPWNPKEPSRPRRRAPKRGGR